MQNDYVVSAVYIFIITITIVVIIIIIIIIIVVTIIIITSIITIITTILPRGVASRSAGALGSSQPKWLSTQIAIYFDIYQKAHTKEAQLPESTASTLGGGL